MKIFLYIFLFLMITSHTFGQNDNKYDSAYVKQLTLRATNLGFQGKIDEAISTVDSALAIHNTVNILDERLDSYNLKATFMLQKGLITESRLVIQKALNLAEKTKLTRDEKSAKGRLLTKLSNTYSYEQKLDSAEIAINQSITLLEATLNDDESHVDLASSLTSAGNVSMRQYNTLGALDYYNQSLKILEKLNLSALEDNYNLTTLTLLSQNYANLGIQYYHLGNYSSSETNLKKAIQLSEERALSNLSIMYLYLSRLYSRIGKHVLAIESMKKAIRIKISNSLDTRYPLIAFKSAMVNVLYDSNEFDEALKICDEIINTSFIESDYYKSEALSTKARILLEKKDFNNSLHFLHKAIKINQETNPNGSPYQSGLSNLIGLNYIGLGKYDSARNYFKQVINYSNRRDQHLERLIQSHCAIGESYFLEEKYEKALDYFNKAIYTALKNKNNALRKENMSVPIFTIADPLVGKMNCVMKLAKSKDNKLLDECEEQLMEFIGYLNEIDVADDDKVILRQNMSFVYETLFEYYLSIGRDEDAINIIQKAKKTNLSISLSSRNFSTLLPSDIVNTKDSLNMAINYHESRLAEAENKKELEEKIFILKKKQESLIKLPCTGSAGISFHCD